MAMIGILKREFLGDRREWARDLGVATAAGIFLGLVGPFGSYLNDSPLIVLAYWVVALWVGTILFGLIVGPIARGAFGLRGPRIVLLAAASGVAAIPLAVICRLAALALWPDAIRPIGDLAWYGQTLVISAPFAITYGLLKARKPAPAPDPQPAPPADDADFLSRLPPHLGREVLALQMEDHYVRVHTSIGSTLVLTPLGQAIRALEGIPGIRIHRSWWVARSAVAGSVRDGRNIRLRLVNGLEAPVARTSIAEARSAGLLRDQGER